MRSMVDLRCWFIHHFALSKVYGFGTEIRALFIASIEMVCCMASASRSCSLVRNMGI